MIKNKGRRGRVGRAPKDTQPQAVDYSALPWRELQAAAKQQGISTYRMSRAELEAALAR